MNRFGHVFVTFALVAIGAPSAGAAEGEQRGTFVTTLGTDTVAVESYVRTAAQLEGDIVLRVPGRVRYHYKLTFAEDGSVKRSAFEIRPASGSGVDDQRRLTLDFDRGSVKVTSLANGEPVIATRPGDPSPNVWFLGGYGPSFGIYASYGMYEYLLTRVKVNATETTTLNAFSASTGEPSQRLFRRKTATSADLDYFRAAWIHVTLDDAGLITAADARQTTELTTTKREPFMDIALIEKDLAAADKAGRGLGPASPNVETKGSIGGASVNIKYGSPRLRGRTGAMDALRAAGTVWRTGANEATVIDFSRDVLIGDQRVPAGKYSLWTLPSADGVKLIVNKETGQWGTAYKSAQDLVRVPMKIDKAETPTDNFTISIRAQGDAGELRLQWDTFIWSVALALAPKS